MYGHILHRFFLSLQIGELNAEVNQLIEKRMRSGEPADDKLSLFRQQAAIIGHKKEAAAENLRANREEFNRITNEFSQKQELVANAEGSQQVLKGEDVSL